MNDVRKPLMRKQSLQWRALLIGITAATLSMVAAAAKPPTAKVQVPQASPVIRTLLAGGDARAVVADALTKQAAPTTTSALKTAAGSSAFGTYAAGVRQLRAALAATQSAWTASAATSARGQLADALASLHARRLLVDARIAQIDRLVAAPAMPAVAHQRWAAHRDRLVAAVSRIDAAVQSASDQLAASSKRSALPAFADLNDLIATESRASAAPTYAAATLPLYRPHLGVRDPATSPAITPSYADAVGDVTPVAADYAATSDAPLSQAILNQAQSLDHDYTRIFDFVRSQVRTQWYAGAQKGAESTLRTLAGNDVDQASLLIALLRASGAPARYVRGVIDVPMADLMSMLGVREDEVGLALSAAGVPNRAVVTAGHISGFAIEHVYVSAYLPFANYRGSAADLDGRAWLPLMPAIKPHAFVPAAGAMASAGISAGDFVTQYLASAQTLAPLDLLRQQVSDRLSALSPPLVYADQLARLAVNAPPIELLPASTPVVVEAVTAEFAQLPESLRQHAHIVVRAGSNAGDPIVFDRVFALQQLIDHRVSLAYQPASVDDGRIADQHGGFGTTPPYLVHVRPILNIAGLPAAAGTGEVENGATQRVEITLDSPAGTSALAQDVTAGGIAALVFDAQDNAPPEQANNVVLPGESESEAARLLSNFGARYLSTWDQADDELGRLLGVSVMRPFPSVALVINQYRLDRVGGVADALVWRGVGLDAALRPVEPYTQTAANGAAADWMQLASLQGSVLEHQLFEQQWSVDSISADKGLALALVAGNPVLSLNQSSGTSGLHQPQSVIDNIAAWLARGYVVDVPRDPITYEDWSGAVWRVRSLSSGESGYFISGALAGGSTAMPPELWYFQDLAALLANPYAENPDTDPMSGVALSIDASAQYQDGVVNTTLAKPLRATVIDAGGRPVQGAQVTFTLTNGTAKLLDVNGAETTQAVIATDRHGVASAQLHMGKSLGNFGGYRVDPGNSYPQFVGVNQVEVSATGDVGLLYAGQPYTEYVLPDAPTQLKFLGSSDIKLSPGISYVPSWIDVTDQYDNEVSNVAISLNAATNYTPNSCNTSGTQVATVDATLFTPGQCPDQVVQLTGNACAQAALTTTSQPGGAPFFVVPPATALAQVNIAGSAASATGTLNLSTEDALFGSCYVDKIYSVPLWVYSPSLGYTPLLDYYATVLDAAPPGEVMPAPQRVDAFQGDVIHGDHAGIIWHPVNDAKFDPHLQNGSLESYHGIGGGSYLTDLRAGPDPGPVHGQVYLSWDDVRVAIRGVVNQTNAPNIDFNDLTFAWSVALSAPQITPSPVPLTPFGATDSTMRIEVKALPAEYIAAPVQIDILKDNEVVTSCSVSVAKLGGFYCDISRGLLVDTSKQYSARVVLNDGNPFRMESASTPIKFGQVIIGGYGIVPHSASSSQNTQTTNRPKDLGGDIADELALVQGRYPKKLTLNDSVDVPSGYTCTVGQRFGFLVSRNATVTLEFHKLDAQGNPSPIVAWTALDGVTETIGLHDVLITSVDLPIGDYSYELKAIAADGTVEDYIGSAAHHTQRLDSLPLAHSFVKGVDVYSGGAVASEDDISIGGRGPGMKLTRTYASNQGDERGFFGRGWSTDLDAQVLTDNCDTRIVRGSAGQGQRFAPAGTDANGNVQFTALSGYHGTLVQTGGDYDFYAKDGTRYHFGQYDRSGPRLSYIEDTNGNRVAYTYEVNQGEQHVTRIEDSAGRHIDLTYTIKDVETQESGITIEHVFTIVSDAVGPGGLRVHYDYDANGNLIKATRSDGTSGTREHAYTYDDLGGYFITQPDGAIQYYRFGYRLKTTKNLLDNAQRSYDYTLGWSAVDVGGGDIQYIPVQRVTSVTEPDTGKTVFAYDGVRGLAPVATDVTDARSNGTHYVLNRYGAATQVTDPAGTTATDWDMTHLEPHTITDALGTVTTFAYDAAGNKTSESIVDTTATIARSWTYKSPGEFALPFIKNRVATATDGNQNLTQYSYDERGNPIQITRGGISEQDNFDANGDHASHTDGLGKVWLWRYDANGYPREAEDPLHHVTATTFDERGRKLSETDANAHVTKYTYDAQDRLLATTYPPTNAGTGVQTSAYDDAADTRTDKNPNGHSTISSFDTMGRLINVRRADGHARALQYDKNGNLTQEADFSGDVTTYVYDDANRRTETHAPEGRDTIDAYDALGHVTKETVRASGGSDTRITEYEYKHPLYKRTLVRRHLDASNIDTATQYDNNGNATQITDPIGRITTRHYDARDRMFEEDAPYGRVTKTLFDDADRAAIQTVVNPGHEDQVTHNEYDYAGRLTATIDAVHDRRSIGYDNTKNVTSRSDARGNLTHYIYDARDELTSQTGPESGQVTSYTYDLAGNRVTEIWSNGNTRTSTYDVLERRTATTDSVGTVESFTYTPDDKIATRTDANGHKTTNHYDGLQRLHQQDLPTVAAGARQIVKNYDVHGDVLSETDAGQHTTSHTYDDLGRLQTTTLPVVDGNSATLQFSYDDVNRPTAKTDARGNVTTISYDDSAHTKTQTDPTTPDGSFSQTWTYDAIGNEIAHTDRRGIITRTLFDAANRARTITRDGLTTSTRSYEDGRVKTDTDALGRVTTNVYDKAGRRTEEDRPLGAQRTWTYWPIGDVHTAIDEDGRTTVSTYTPRRYLESTSLAGETTTYTYDGEGHRTSMQRPLGDAYTWHYSYDAGDRLSSVTDPLNDVTTYAYDLDGNLTKQTDANNHVTAFAYDARDRRTSQTWPTTAAGSAVEYWTYDADGNIATQITPNDRTITYAVDALNRTTSESVSSPAPSEIATTTWHHDGNGNVVAIDETLGDSTTRTTSNHYDAFDRPDQVTDEHGKNLIYQYDAVGNRSVLTDADGQNTTWAFDALNHNIATTVIGQGTSTIDHYPSGRVHVLTRPDASTTTTEYDAAGRIASIVHAKAGNELAHDTYRYDLNGNRIEQKESNGAVTGDSEQITGYSYDAADRLTQVVTPQRTTDYSIDPVGNRTGEQIRNAANTLIGNSTLVYNEREQLTARDDAVTSLHVSLSYDADGNTATETDSTGTRTFSYDAHDRLLNLAMPAQLPLTFDYNADGLRIAKHQGSAETRYQYDQQSLLAETNAIGNTTVRYHYSATQLLSRTEAGSTPTQRQYLNDALNSPIATLKQGAVDSRTKYDAWGEIAAQQGTGGAVTTPSTDGTFAELAQTDDQDIGFTGYLKDSESGFYYAKARYYDSRIARFTTEDPEAGKAMNPPSLHRYLYAYANPTVYMDPSGRLADGDNVGAMRLAAALAHNEKDRATMEHIAALTEHENAKTGAGIIGTFSSLVQGVVGTAQLVSDAISGAAVTDAIGQRFGAQPTGAAERAQAVGHAVAHPIDTFRQSIDRPLQEASDAAARGDDIAQAFHEGEALGNFVNAAMGARGLVGLARGGATGLGGLVRQGRAVTITEGESGSAAAVAQKPPVSQADVDSDFGPINRLTHEERVASAGDRVVTFGGTRLPKYSNSPNATLGPKSGSIWVMPIDDAARLQSRADVVTQTGRAPGVTTSFRQGERIYGLSVPTKGIDLRLPKSTDAGTNIHFREGGNTGVSRRNGWYQNPTREFIFNGGEPMPPGTVLFEFNPDGSWTLIRRF